MPTMYAGLVGPEGELRLYDGRIRFATPAGATAAEIDPAQYADSIGEASLADSYLKAPYYKPLGYPAGIYRVGPLARLNVAARCGTDKGGDITRQAFRGPAELFDRLDRNHDGALTADDFDWSERSPFLRQSGMASACSAASAYWAGISDSAPLPFPSGG